MGTHCVLFHSHVICVPNERVFPVVRLLQLIGAVDMWTVRTQGSKTKKGTPTKNESQLNARIRFASQSSSTHKPDTRSTFQNKNRAWRQHRHLHPGHMLSHVALETAAVTTKCATTECKAGLLSEPLRLRNEQRDKFIQACC
jgi:hypothetical protein